MEITYVRLKGKCIADVPNMHFMKGVHPVFISERLFSKVSVVLNKWYN